MIMEEKDNKKTKYKELKNEVYDLNTSVKNLKNQLDRQGQYSRRNCISIHGITETQDEKTDDISLRTINDHLEIELTEKELGRTQRVGNQNQEIKGQDLLMSNSHVTIPEERFL